MNTSLFELFKIGIGPSSSHTVGPMRAALRFVNELKGDDFDARLVHTTRVQVDLYGSLALTGIGHGTDRAILLGLEGHAPDTIDPDSIEKLLTDIRATSFIRIAGYRPIPFSEGTDLIFHRNQMYPDPDIASHPNGMRFSAFNQSGEQIADEVFYSIGGGFIVSDAERTATAATSARIVPYAFRSAAELLDLAASHELTIAQLVLANEIALLQDTSININRPTLTSEPSDPHRPFHPENDQSPVVSPIAPGAPLPPLPTHPNRDQWEPPTPPPIVPSSESAEAHIRNSILALWHVMQSCTERGIATEGILPGGLNVRRRAHRLAERLNTHGSKDPLAPIDWVTVYAMAVNEENAAGGRVVTAPTNGAAGVIPAIAHYYMRYIDGIPEEKQDGFIRYFLTAAAIGILYKENASISGAEVGCQGEVGVACSMAAGGLVAALNGTNAQIEHAAEIAMEHNLGMTCDPIGGLVQIPCIERNGMGAVKAINAARMAMNETEGHKISLDQIIATMYQTGLDMQSRYKETSLAGLALNIIEC